MDPTLQATVDRHSLHHGLIVDVLERLSDELLGFTCGRGMGTLGKQFLHIADVEVSYTEALGTRRMDFARPAVDHSLESSQRDLLVFLRSAEQRLRSTLRELTQGDLETIRIDWTRTHQHYADGLPVHSHLEALIEHEILHEGELVVYMRSLGLELPPSWKILGLVR